MQIANINLVKAIKVAVTVGVVWGKGTRRRTKEHLSSIGSQFQSDSQSRPPSRTKRKAREKCQKSETLGWLRRWSS